MSTLRRYFVLFDNHELCYYTSKPNFPDELRRLTSSSETQRSKYTSSRKHDSRRTRVNFPARASESKEFPPRGVIDLRDVRSFWRFRGRSRVRKDHKGALFFCFTLNRTHMQWSVKNTLLCSVFSRLHKNFKTD